MNYRQPWQELNIDITNAIRSDIDFNDILRHSSYVNEPAGVWRYHREDVEKLLSSSWINDMYLLGLKVQHVLLFYRIPYYTHPEAHIDVRPSRECISAFNWVIDPLDDSEMVWYDFPPTPGDYATSYAGTDYKSWPMAQIKDYEFARKVIGAVPTLVRTGIPHNVVVKSRPRWSVSIRIDDHHLDNWEQTVDFFKPWIKNADC